MPNPGLRRALSRAPPPWAALLRAFSADYQLRTAARRLPALLRAFSADHLILHLRALSARTPNYALPAADCLLLQKELIDARQEPAGASLHDQIRQPVFRFRIHIDLQRALQQRSEFIAVLFRNGNGFSHRNQRAG